MFYFAAGVSEYKEHVELENHDFAGNEGNENGGVYITLCGESWGDMLPCACPKATPMSNL